VTAHTTLEKVAGTKLTQHPSVTALTPASGTSGTQVNTKVKGVTTFDNKPVADWIAPILKYAQAHGWTGTVNSGFRSFAQQKQIYDSGVRPAAVPGTSNHEGTQWPAGAVDVTQAQQLSNILLHSPFARALVYAGSKDPVHFSHPHNGSY
jgi:D-alanyl-D-alanine carboxypeptidase